MLNLQGFEESLIRGIAAQQVIEIKGRRQRRLRLHGEFKRIGKILVVANASERRGTGRDRTFPLFGQRVGVRSAVQQQFAEVRIAARGRVMERRPPLPVARVDISPTFD